MNIVDKTTDELIPYAQNPRKNDAAVDGVAASIKEFGFKVPIIITDDNTIVCGHTRLKAAQKLGLKTVPCLVASDLSPDQVKALRVLDNKLSERAEWDAELLELELSEIELDFEPFDVDFEVDLPEPQADTSEDDVPEVPDEPVSKLGDLWKCGEHRVLCGDATSELHYGILFDRQMGGSYARDPILMVTDPPYGVNYDPTWRKDADVSHNKKKFGKVANDDRADWFDAWRYQRADVAYVWHDACQTDVVLDSLRRAGFSPASMIIWNKERFALSRADYHYKHEPCWYVIRDGKNHNWQGARDQCTVWDINAREDSGHGHGTQKPIECMARPIRNNTREMDVVYDPFIGSGTTLIAAHRLNRLCYGIEIEPRYVDVICRRFYNETGIVPVKEDGTEFPVYT